MWGYYSTFFSGMLIGASTMTQWNQFLPTKQVTLFVPETNCPSKPVTIAQLPAALNLPQAALTDDGASNELIVVGGYDSIAYGFRFFRYVPGSIKQNIFSPSQMLHLDSATVFVTSVLMYLKVRLKAQTLLRRL
jgi:hypothetical protein